MKTKLYLPLLAVLALAITSCSKMGELSPEYFTVNPNPLEVVAGKIPATIEGRFPEKYFNKKAIVEVTPVLVYNGGEARSASKTFQGEKVKANNEVIEYKAGGSYKMSASFDYVPAMAVCELYLEFKATLGKKEVIIPRVKVADGVLATSELCDPNNATSAIAADKFQRIITDKYEADIKFLIQQAQLRPTEMKKDAFTAFTDNLKAATEDKNRNVTGIEVSSYASPDGGLDINTPLAEKREKVTVDFMNKQLKKINSAVAIDAKFTPEDWDGFAELVSASAIQDKDLIIRVLSMYSDPEQRETEIKNLSSAYTTLKDDILPQLRRSKLTAAYEIIGKSDEEITALFASDPTKLSLEEMLYAATLKSNVDDKLAIYLKVAEVYPTDFRGFNNAASCYFAKGNVAAAEQWANKAAGINAAPEVHLNLALVAMSNKNLAKAEQHLGKASATAQVKEALGVLYVEKGEYAKAVNAFGDIKTNEAALAQILTKDYNKAQATLKGVAKANATTSYLKAIVGARTNNATMVKENLQEVAKTDAALAKRAQTDIEFAKFADVMAK